MIRIFNIVWDTESDGEVYDPDELGLPKEVVVDDSEIDEPYEETIADYLSDKYDWCVYSCDYAHITSEHGSDISKIQKIYRLLSEIIDTDDAPTDADLDYDDEAIEMYHQMRNCKEAIEDFGLDEGCISRLICDSEGTDFVFHMNPKYDMAAIADSIQIEKGETIATLRTNRSVITLEVCGDVRVYFNPEPNDNGDYVPGDGTLYSSYADFPDELKELVINHKIYDDPRVSVENNNWFEVFEHNLDEQFMGASDTVDCEGKTPTEILGILLDYERQCWE